MKDTDINFLQRPVHWNMTESAEFPFKATMNQQKWLIRVNGSPEQSMYTLIINDQEIIDFDDWPQAWSRPEFW